MARVTANVAVVSDNGLWYWAAGHWWPLSPGASNKPGFRESRLKGLPLDFITAEQLAENGEALAWLMQEDKLSLEAAEEELAQYWFGHSTGVAYFDGTKVLIVWREVGDKGWVAKSEIRPIATLEAVRRFLDVDGTTITFYRSDTDPGLTIRACQASEQVELFLTAITEAKPSVEINADASDAYLSRDDGGRRALIRLAKTTGLRSVAITQQAASRRVSLCPECKAPLPPKAQQCSFCKAYIERV